LIRRKGRPPGAFTRRGLSQMQSRAGGSGKGRDADSITAGSDFDQPASISIKQTDNVLECPRPPRRCGGSKQRQLPSGSPDVPRGGACACASACPLRPDG
jgi:hypothetical protein